MQNNEILPCKKCGALPVIESFLYRTFWSCNNCGYSVTSKGQWLSFNTQPRPIPNTNKPIWDLVIDDMIKRDQAGRKRYGTPLQAFNGRDALQDAYEEALDLAVYLKQAIEERKK